MSFTKHQIHKKERILPKLLSYIRDIGIVGMAQELAALYSRVSTKNQDINPQQEKLKDWAEYEDVEYTLYQDDGISAVADTKPGYEKMMENIEDYDYLVITNLDRLGRATHELTQLCVELQEMDVDLVVTEQSIDTSTKEGKFLFDILSAVAELERKITRERLKDGYKEALDAGEVGRPKLKLNVDRMVEMYRQGVTISALADTFGVSRNTIYDRLNEAGVTDAEVTNSED